MLLIKEDYKDRNDDDGQDDAALEEGARSRREARRQKNVCAVGTQRLQAALPKSNTNTQTGNNNKNKDKVAD